MSDYVGIDVHRKRSQLAVVTEDGKVPGSWRSRSPPGCEPPASTR